MEKKQKITCINRSKIEFLKDDNSSNKLYNLFDELSPTELAKALGKDQTNSTRDKNRFLKKVVEIQHVLNKLNIELFFKKK